MLIRKLFKFDGSHIVRNCTSRKCSHSIHGHTFKVEVLLKSNYLDSGQMVVDFGLLKSTVKDWVESFDHCHIMWSKESDELKDFFKKYNSRWIILPCSPSAEMLSIMFFFVIDKIIKHTVFNNGEMGVELYSVIVHETESGYAQSFYRDLVNLWRWELKDIEISPEIIQSWKYPKMMKDLSLPSKFIINPIVEHQV